MKLTTRDCLFLLIGAAVGLLVDMALCAIF